MTFDIGQLRWVRKPDQSYLSPEQIRLVTQPHTDLWQRTYYHFRNDSAPLLLLDTDLDFFSFTVRTDFDSRHRYDQCGVAVYLDSENWLKASIECENDRIQHLGSVVTNLGYSDWATTEIDASIKSMWYRLSRRQQDFRLECSLDGKTFQQMRICHLHKATGPIAFGLYACSPEDSSFQAVFSHLSWTDCLWAAHDGQPPDPV